MTLLGWLSELPVLLMGDFLTGPEPCIMMLETAAFKLDTPNVFTFFCFFSSKVVLPYIYLWFLDICVIFGRSLIKGLPGDCYFYFFFLAVIQGFLSGSVKLLVGTLCPILLAFTMAFSYFDFCAIWLEYCFRITPWTEDVCEDRWLLELEPDRRLWISTELFLTPTNLALLA